MDLQSIGECVGAGLASFVATWLALVRPMGAKLKEMASPEDVKALRELHRLDLKEVGKA